MDCSWLLEDVEEGGSASESDSEKEQNELEERLYGILHHSARDELQAPEIAKNFSVQCADNGEIVVQLKKSLEEIKADERNCHFNRSQSVIDMNDSIDQLSPTINSNNNDSDEIVIIAENFNNEELQHVKKRFRYSDVNIDHEGIERKKEKDNNNKHIDFFSVGPAFYRKGKTKFLRLAIPKSLKSSDWKTSANEGFISIQNYNDLNEIEVVDKMLKELKRVNPHEKHKFLLDFAQQLYRRNVKLARKKEKVRLRKSMKNDLSNGAFTPNSQDHKINKPQNTPINHEDISLNISSNYCRVNGSIPSIHSPFIPCTSTPYKTNDTTVFIDLTSKETSLISKGEKNKSKLLSQSSKIGTPKKWSKQMIRYYTTPSYKKMVADINVIQNKLKRKSVADDWKLDPLDRSGSYKNNIKKMRLTGGRKCANCREFGHFIRDCPKPRKIVTCTFCGDYYHTDYTCPNTICRKCGIHTPKDDERFSGLCEVCYRSDFENEGCRVCGEYTHHSEICTDLWRKYHATTAINSDIVIPEVTNENPRKFCSNCSGKGHFSHQCPEAGDKTSPLITNYTDKHLDMGSILYSFYPDKHNINNRQFDNFLQNLSTATSTSISLEPNHVKSVLRIHGTFERCKNASSEIENYVNTRKRKRNEPEFTRKRRRM